MKFYVDKKVFKKLPNVCFMLVYAKNIDNTKNIKEIKQMLESVISESEKYFENKNVKECESILCYRNAFQTLGINPNKYMCSIEALCSRIAKKKGMPFINSIVDLVNAVSIKHRIPMGSHDLQSMDNDFSVSFALDGYTFMPFGESETENVDIGELVYTSGRSVRTRKWIWRQSELGKITENATDIIFPIDAFKNINEDKAIEAQSELVSLLKKYFNAEVKTTFIDINQNEFLLS